MKKFAGAVMYVLAQVFDPREDMKMVGEHVESTKTIKTPSSMSGSTNLSLEESSVASENKLSASTASSSNGILTDAAIADGDKQSINPQPSARLEETLARARTINLHPWMICEPNEKEGKFLLNEIMQAGNFGKYDDRISHETPSIPLLRGKKVPVQLWHAIEKTKHNLRLLTHYPEEVICEPFFRVYHWIWRRFEIWRYKPCFYLENIVWDDYGHKTSFKLYYVDQDGNYLSVGKVKICKKDENRTMDVIPKSFLSLDSNYCSLGQDTSYYSVIKRILGEDAFAFLYAMKDASAFSRISDDFVNDSGFRHSLLRDNNADTALNLGRYVLAGFDPDDRINFTYKTQLAYAPDIDFNIKFDFGRINQEDNFNRVIAIIGENGVGKTSLLSNLAKSIANQQKDCFLPHYPLFTKVVAASYSMFDRFYDIDARAFNFEYCGMHNSRGGLMNQEELKSRHERNAKTINALNRGRNLRIF